MVVGIKDAAKLVGISIVVCCAVLVCTMFVNFYIDIQQVENMISTDQMQYFFDALVLTSRVICLISGGCLLLTSIVMLFFYIRHYIDTHKKELGILKALGHSNMKIAKNFWVFGSGIFIGAAVGFAGAFLLMPMYYNMQNEDHILPEITINFHPELLLIFVVLPTVVFAFIAIFYACIKLKKPVLSLLRDDFQTAAKTKKLKDSNKNCTFIEDLRRNTLRSKKVLVFFIIFSSFCFSTMTQMSASMDELASVMMGIMILVIGIVLACTTLVLAITTVVKGNTKTIAMMRVFGYSHKECCKALLGGYRPVSYIGFAIGTLYQHFMLKFAVEIIFMDLDGVPEYSFDFKTMIISFIFFVAFYELTMYYYTAKIKKVSVKEIMIE